jgi:hypothetical protein
MTLSSASIVYANATDFSLMLPYARVGTDGQGEILVLRSQHESSWVPDESTLWCSNEI